MNELKEKKSDFAKNLIASSFIHNCKNYQIHGLIISYSKAFWAKNVVAQYMLIRFDNLINFF